MPARCNRQQACARWLGLLVFALVFATTVTGLYMEVRSGSSFFRYRG